MTIATLSIDIEARLAKLEAGFTKAQRLAGKTAEAIEQRFKSLEAVFGGVGSALAGVLSVGAVTAWLRNIAGGLDAINDAADATGSTVEKLSGLEDLANRTGGSFDGMVGAVVKLNQQLNAATPGSETERALNAIGLSAEELRRLDPVDALQKVALALAGYADDGNKARLVQELFGKSVREVAPLLKDLAEAGQLNATVTREQAEEAEKFNRNLAAAQTFILELSRALGGPLLDGINKAAAAWRDLNKTFESLAEVPWLRAGFRTGGGLLSGGDFKKGADETREVIAGLEADLLRLERASQGRFGQNNEREQAKLLDRLEGERKLLYFFQQRLAVGENAAQYSNEGYGKAAPKASIVAPPKTSTGKAPEPPRLDARLEPVRETFKPLSTKSLGLQSVEAFVRQYDRNIEEAASFSEQLQIQTAEMNANLLGSERARGEAQIELDRQILQRRLDGLSTYDTERERQQAELDANIAARTASLEEQLKPQWVRLLESWGDTTEQMAARYDDFTTGLLSNTEDVFAEFVRTGKLNFDALAEYALQAISKIIAQKAILGLVEGIGSLFVPSGFANASPSALGNVFGPSGQITAFANGGVVGSPTYFGYEGGRRTGLMGEAGPEAIMPLSRGPDGKLGVRTSGQAAPVVNIHVASGVSRSELAAMLPSITAQVEASVFSRLRRPGFRGA